MDARLRNLFSRRRSQKHDQLRLKAHPYESTVKQRSPTKGTRPIAGNGPYRLENVALQARDLGAEPPDVPRSRRDSYPVRPRTAPQPAQFLPNGRAPSPFPARGPSPAARRAHEPSLTNPYHRPQSIQRVRSVAAFPSEPLLPPTPNPSTHVDILDAVAWINPSPQTFLQKRIASGKRDYGEDVADRNIAEFGGDEFPPHDAYSSYTDDAGGSQDEPNREDEMQGGQSGPERGENLDFLDSRDGSTRGSVGDGAGDDTTIRNQRTSSDHSTSQISSNDNQNSSKTTPPTTANGHARHESATSNYSSAKSKRGGDRSGRSSSASTEVVPTAIPTSMWSDIAAANPYYISGAPKHALSMNESPRKPANSNQPIRNTRESRGTQTTPPPPEPTVVPPTAPVTILDSEDSDSDVFDPPPISRSRLSRRTILPTPPMSPTAGVSPTTSVPRVSLDEDLPPPPSGTQTYPASERHSSGESGSYPGSLPRESDPRGSPLAPTATATTFENSTANSQSENGKRSDLVLEGSSEPPRLEGIVDTSNTTDTEVITEQPPTVVHEHVTPKVHQIREERITREVHTHDVFHRIQPVIDVEVLPTKHYIPAPNGRGLIEILESQLPGRHKKRTVQPTDGNVVTYASDPPGVNSKTAAKTPECLSSRAPRIQDREKSLTEDGIVKDEIVWCHPPQLKTGGLETGQTVPLQITHHTDDDMDDAASERYAASVASDPYAGSTKTVSTNADGEEELLFRDSDLAFDGHLPGLEDVNPVVAEGSLPPSRPSTAATASKADGVGGAEGEGEATKALIRRREAELARKMGRLSVVDRK